MNFNSDKRQLRIFEVPGFLNFFSDLSIFHGFDFRFQAGTPQIFRQLTSVKEYFILYDFFFFSKDDLSEESYGLMSH